MSDITVAPTVTVTGSRRPKPSRSTTVSPSSVCDASSEPITIAGIIAYPNTSPTEVPRSSGSTVVTIPRAIERLRARRNNARSISKPAKNISSSFPSSARKSAIGRSVPKMPRTYGPIITPPSNKPTAPGTCRRRERRGMVTSITIPIANLASTGSVKRWSRMKLMVK